MTSGTNKDMSDNVGTPTVETRRMELLRMAEKAITLLIDEIMLLPYTPTTRWAHGSCTYSMVVLQKIKKEIGKE